MNGPCRIEEKYRGLTENQLEIEGEAGQEIKTHFDRLRDSRDQSRLDLYIDSSFERHRTKLEEGASGPPSGGERQVEDFWPELSSFLAHYKPLYSETSKRLRFLQTAAADDGSWSWRQVGDAVFSRRGPSPAASRCISRPPSPASLPASV